LEIVWVTGGVDVRERPPRPREREESDSSTFRWHGWATVWMVWWLTGGKTGSLPPYKVGVWWLGLRMMVVAYFEDGVVAYWREIQVTPPVMWSVVVGGSW